MNFLGIVMLFLVSLGVNAGQEKKTSHQLELIEQEANYAEDWVWRFVPGSGWRKFSPMGDAYQEYKDFRRVTRHKFWYD